MNWPAIVLLLVMAAITAAGIVVLAMLEAGKQADRLNDAKWRARFEPNEPNTRHAPPLPEDPADWEWPTGNPES